MYNFFIELNYDFKTLSLFWIYDSFQKSFISVSQTHTQHHEVEFRKY